MTDYIHDYDDHLVNNLHHSMELVDGIPHLRVSLGSDNITVTGDVNIATEIKINNTDQQSIPVHLTDDPIGVTGQFWQATQPVSIASMPTTPVTGTFWQATQPVSIASLPNITGSVSVSNFPGIQAVSGNFYPETQPVSIASMPTTPVTGTFWPATQNVSGTVELGATTLEALENTTVNIGTMPEVEIKNDSANPIPISKNTTANSPSNPLAVEWVYGSGASLIPWEVQVARGKIPGVTGLSIAGYNASIGTEWAAIWEYNRPYEYLTTAQTLRLWSSSASDTDVTVAIQGLDANYNPINETVHLTNGTTGVMTTQSFFRVNTMNLTQTPMNVGNISVGSSDKSIECATIMPDAGRSQMCVYTVPAGYTFYLTQANILTNQVGSQTALYRSYTKQPNGVTNSIIIFPFVQTYNSRKVCARPYTEKTDIQWQAQSSQGTSRIGGQIEGFLIANSTS